MWWFQVTCEVQETGEPSGTHPRALGAVRRKGASTGEDTCPGRRGLGRGGGTHPAGGQLLELPVPLGDSPSQAGGPWASAAAAGTCLVGRRRMEGQAARAISARKGQLAGSWWVL